jgi:hypothetical protein
MNLIKHQGNILKQIGSMQVIPGVSDSINSFVDNVTGETSKKQDEKIRALEAEVAAGKKTQQQAEMEAKGTGMKKGGKVKSSSASKRADGCAVKGKTKGRMV